MVLIFIVISLFVKSAGKNWKYVCYEYTTSANDNDVIGNIWAKYST